jgi:surface carbohydrate biosynthesis protein
MEHQAMYRILLFSDVRFRDAPGSALVKYYLNQYPDTMVLVASFNYWSEAINLFHPHAVVINHIQGTRNNRIARAVKNAGGTVFVQFNEGIIEFHNKQDIFLAQRDNDWVDHFLCWSKHTADLVGGQIIGCPRFDIYSPEFKSMIDSPELFRELHNIPSDKSLALFGSSFPSAKFTYMLQAFHASNWVDLGNNVAEEWASPEAFAASQHDNQKLFRGSAVINDVVNGDKMHTVVKPHPMSDFNSWRMFSTEWGIPTVSSEYIFNALNAADVFVGKLGSLAVAEAWMLGKPAVRINFGYETSSSEDQLNADRLVVSSTSDIAAKLPEMIANPERTKEEIANAKRYTKEWGISTFGASRRTADFVYNNIKSRIVDYDSQPDVPKLLGIMANHDDTHRGFYMDGYGNFNKAVRWEDIVRWTPNG